MGRKILEGAMLGLLIGVLIIAIVWAFHLPLGVDTQQVLALSMLVGILSKLVRS